MNRISLSLTCSLVVVALVAAPAAAAPADRAGDGGPSWATAFVDWLSHLWRFADERPAGGPPAGGGPDPVTGGDSTGPIVDPGGRRPTLRDNGLIPAIPGS
jgi:hypothetical protein